MRTISVHDEIRLIRKLWPDAYIREHPNKAFILAFYTQGDDRQCRPVFYRQFSFKLRSREEAKGLARAVRDKQYVLFRTRKEINVFRKLAPVYSEAMRPSKHGQVGVSRHERFNRSNGRDEIIWTAKWREYVLDKEGEILRKSKVKSFSVGKRSEEEAKALAVEYRQRMEKYLQSPKHQRLRLQYLLQKQEQVNTPRYGG